MERSYAHRSVVDKLGIRDGDAVLVAGGAFPIEAGLIEAVATRAGRSVLPGEPLDVVLLAVDPSTDVEAALRQWRARIRPAGAVWLLTSKRGRPGYVDQRALIAAGPAAGMVDNKVCSVSDAVSALRFVIPRAQRAPQD